MLTVDETTATTWKSDVDLEAGVCYKILSSVRLTQGLVGACYRRLHL